MRPVWVALKCHCKHSIASEEYGINQVTFALQIIKIRIWYFGAPDKPCGVVCADVNPKTVAKRYMIVQKVVSLHYESEWQ